MRFNVYQNLNPIIKTLAWLILCFGLLFVDSLQLNIGILFVSIVVLFICVSEIREPIFLVCILLLSFLLSYGFISYMNIECEFYIGEYNYGSLYRSLIYSTYIGIIYLHFQGIIYSVTSLSFSESLHQTLHIPKKVAHKIYRSLLFIEQYEQEATTVQKVYKAKGIAVSTMSWRVFSVVLRNLKRKLNESDLAMEAKGFEESSPSSHYVVYNVEVMDALYLVCIILSLVFAYYYRIW